MATTLVTLTGDVTDAIGTDFDARRTKAYVRHNTPTVVTDDGPIHLGGGTVNVNDDGTFTLPNVVAATSLVENLQATVYIDYEDRTTRTRVTQPFGPYDLSAETGTVDISELEAVQALDPSFASETMAAMQALLDAQAEISGLTGEDSAVAGLISNPLLGVLTGPALSDYIEDLTTDTAGPVVDFNDARYSRTGYLIQVGDSIVGDGSNVSAAIQAIIDPAAAFGAVTIVFPPDKTYGVDAPLRLRSRTHLDFNGSTLLAISATTKACMVGSQGLVSDNGSGGDGTTVIEDASIRNAVLDNAGTSSDNTGKSYAMIYLQRASRVRVIDCKFINVGTRQGIRFSELTQACTAAGNHITMPVDSPYATLTNAQGISLFSATVDGYGGGNTDTQTFTEPTDVSTGHFIVNNTILNGTHGVALAGAQDCVVSDNHIVGPSHRGVIMSPVASRNVISDNVITDFGSAAILMAYGSHRNVVKGNNCKTTNSVGEEDGIRCSFGAHDNLVSGNYVEGCDNRGLVCFTGAVRNQFVGNKVVGCTIGVALYSLLTTAGYFQPAACPTMEYNDIQSNTFYACTTAILLAQGTTTVAATTPDVPILLRRCAVTDNHVYSGTNGISLTQDTTGNLTAIGLHNNIFDNLSGTPFSSTGTAAVTRGTFPFGSISGNAGILAGSKTSYSPGLITAGASVSTTVTVTGARGGDQPDCSYSLGLAAGLIMFASVTGNDTVTVTIFNATAGSLTPGASATLRVSISKL